MKGFKAGYILNLKQQTARVTLVKELRRSLAGQLQLNSKDHRPQRRPTINQLQISGLATRATMSRRSPIEPQRVDAQLTQSATFLVLSITDR
jgi:hypothetical protein